MKKLSVICSAALMSAAIVSAYANDSSSSRSGAGITNNPGISGATSDTAAVGIGLGTEKSSSSMAHSNSSSGSSKKGHHHTHHSSDSH